MNDSRGSVSFGSADRQSAVSRIGNPQAVRSRCVGEQLFRVRPSADCQSATQQTNCLRYRCIDVRLHGKGNVIADILTAIKERRA
jgi:hypothetical protein